MRMAPQDHPRRAVGGDARGNPHGRLLRLLLMHAGPTARIDMAIWRPWCSATFQGSRHFVSLVVDDVAGGDDILAFVETVVAAEFHLPGHILADLSIDDCSVRAVDGDGLSARVSLSALVVEDW